MFQILQIVFCVLSVACVAAILPIGAFFGWKVALLLGIVAFLSFVAMNFCKQAHLTRHPEDYIPEKQEPTEKDEINQTADKQ